MRCCPNEYYDNCRNAVYQCNLCKAGLGSLKSKLYYKPIDSLLATHPAEELTPVSSKSIRTGFKEESKVVSQWIRKTIKSGSVLGDGDVLVGDLHLDVKTRTTTKSFTVRSDEYETGVKRNYDGWVVVNKDGQRLVCLREESFLKLSGKLLEDLSDI